MSPSRMSPSKSKAKVKPSAARKVAAAEPAALKPAGEVSIRMSALAAEIEHLHRHGTTAEAISPEAVQALVSALCKVYSAHAENGLQYHAFSQASPVTPTDVMVTASGLLKAANLAVFELGMWQSWTGR